MSRELVYLITILVYKGTLGFENAVKSSDAMSQAARKRATGASGAGDRLYERLRAQFDVEHTLGWLFHDIHRLLGKSFESRIEGMGLTRSQWRVLISLKRQDGLTQTELADIVELEKAPLGKLLDKLESKGWITRRDDPDDRRARRVYCTAKIERHLTGIAEAARAMFAEALAGMRENEVKSLIDRLQLIKRNLGGTDDVVPAPIRKSRHEEAR
jgi:DNA-binding MarR family transcriptional regulator